ncbi:MAG TPA: hypothetical protein VHG91_09070 [Longimicrobium sp.]|nr:hypothetical protein [Longimicrobium sp.]
MRIRLLLSALALAGAALASAPGAAQAATIAGEDCIAYAPQLLRIENEGTDWLLTDGTRRMLVLATATDARQAFTVARAHTAQCFVGREKAARGGRPMEYWKGDSRLPTGPIRGEVCTRFDPDDLRVEAGAGTGWTLTDGRRVLHRFQDEADARLALEVARGFTRQCVVGHRYTGPRQDVYLHEYWR